MSLPTSDNTVNVTRLGSILSTLWAKLKTALSGKQDKLTSQTAYSAKGTATKVPQITTNSLGQVTGITEVTISGVTPASHASTATTYGIGTTSTYGHVKLVTGDMNGATNVDGAAVSMNHTHSQYAPKASPALTGTPTAPTAADGTNTTQIATTAFVQSAVTQGLSVSDAMVYKGTITLGATSPGGLTVAADKGHTYKVVANGNTKAGYVDGVKVEAGDMVICNADSTAAATSSNYSTIAAKWDFVQGNTDGVVVGPASATSGNVVLFDGATGKLVQDGGTLGTAAFKNVASSGNASTTQVVMGNDSRLTDSRTPTAHTHGNIQNDGTLQTNDVTIANGAKLVITDANNSNKVARASAAFDGSTTSKVLTQKGTFESMSSITPVQYYLPSMAVTSDDFDPSLYSRYQMIGGTNGAYAALYLMYDITEFCDGTIVNISAEMSSFSGTIIEHRVGGYPYERITNVTMAVSYGNPLTSSNCRFLSSDSPRLYPVIVKETVERNATWTTGAYTFTEGAVPTAVSGASSYRYTDIACSAGQEICVSANISSTYKSWAFLDASGKVISISSTNKYNGTLTAPENAAALRVQISSSTVNHTTCGLKLSTPKYYLAIRTTSGSQSHVTYCGRWYTRKTASASYAARPLLGIYRSNLGEESAANLPAGYEEMAGPSYVIKAGTSVKLATARELAVSLSNTSTTTTFDGSADVTNIKVTGTLPISKGGTNATTAKAAQNNLLGNMNSAETDVTDTNQFVFKYASPAAENGAVYSKPATAMWNYIKGKLTSVSGVNISGNAATATKATQDSDGNAINTTYLKELYQAEYGVSTFADVYAAVTAKKTVYCKVPGSTAGSARMAFLAYVNVSNPPTSSSNIEFQYYRSNSSGTGDSVFVYTITNNNNTWTTVERAASSSVKGNAESTYRTGQVNLTPANLGISATTSSVTVGTTTFNKYTHPTFTAVAAAAKKVGMNSEGHVVLGDALTKSDVGLGNVANTQITVDATNGVTDVTNNKTYKYTHPDGSAASKTGVPTANATLTFGGTFKVNQITTDATSHVSAVTERTLTMPSLGTTSTTAAAGNHAHGNITNTGTITSDTTVASGDKLVIVDADNNKVARSGLAFDGSTTSTFLTKKGTFGRVLYADLGWGGAFRTELTPFDNYAFKACNAFFGAKPVAIRVEYTNDGGTTWTDYGCTDEQKVQLFSQFGGTSVYCGHNMHIHPGYTGSISGTKDLSNDNIANQRVRIVICDSNLNNAGTTNITDQWYYGWIRRFGIYMSTQGASGGTHCLIEYRNRDNFRSNTDTWTSLGDFKIQGDTGWNSIPVNNANSSTGIRMGNNAASYVKEFRFTIWSDTLSSSPAASQTGNLQIMRIVAYGEDIWTNNSTRKSMANFGLPCTVNPYTGTLNLGKVQFTARELSVDLSSTSTTATTFDGTANVSIKNTGTLPVSKGGTGRTSVTSGYYLVGNGTDALTQKTAMQVGHDVLTSLFTGSDNVLGTDYIIGSNHTEGATDATKFVRRTADKLWNYIKDRISSVLGLTATNYGGNAATATTVTSANITRTADTTNGDKLQIGSGTAVNVVNSQSTLNVAAGSATTNTNARHIWFSDSSTETKRAYSGDLTYRTDYNRITTNISGYATGLTRQRDIQHQGATTNHPVHRIASYPSPNITAQGAHADNSLVLHLFTKGHNASDYGIVLITVKLASPVSNNPTVNVRWKLRSSGMPTEAVQAAFIKDASGLWHVDVFFIVQHQYQLTVFNKLGSFSALDGSPNGGWVLHSSNVDSSYADGKECYTDISGDSDDTASMRLYNSIGYDGAATDITDDGIVGTAGSATVADKLANGAGGENQPVYIPTSGTLKGIPQAIGLVQKADNQYYVDMPADRAYGAVVATTAGKAGALNLNGAVGSATRPVYFNAEGAPVAISYKSDEDVGGDSCLNLTVSKAYNARYLNGYSLSVGSYGGVTNTIYFD